MDAFYVNVELQRRPELKGLPVVVAGSGPRAVVTTASYEARKFGIFSATPAARARRLCPQAVFVTPDLAFYRERSKVVMETLRAQVETVEPVSLDEAYLDLTGVERPNAAGRRIKAAVTQATGLACSIGIGPNKLVAKVASDADKPDGFLALTAEQARVRFGPSPPLLIPGIGPKTAAKLEERGITRLDQLGALADHTLSEWFGTRLGPHLAALARFEDERVLEVDRVRKSESRESTFDTDLRGLAEMEPVLADLARQLCEDLQGHGRSGRTVGIKVRTDDFQIHTRARTLPAPVSTLDVLWPVARDLLRTLDPARPVRLLGVRVAGMEEPAPARAGPVAGQLELSV